jgi:hypothetical protein
MEKKIKIDTTTSGTDMNKIDENINNFKPIPDISYTNENTIIFSSVRMNPPTPGHLYLIDTLINIATSININKIFLVLSKTNDCDNPLTCEEKKYWLSQIIKSKDYPVDVEIICVEDLIGATRKSTPFTPISNIIYNYSKTGEKNINLIMVLGSDRTDMLENITDQFYKKNVNVKSIDGIILHRNENMEIFKHLEPVKLYDILSKTEGSVPIESISASLIRKIVSNGYKDVFENIYKNYLSLSDINRFYENIYNSIKNCIPPASKKKSVPKIKGYTYPMVKIDIPPFEKEIGGKIIKRKTKKQIIKKQKINKSKNNQKNLTKRKNKKYNKRLK